MTFSFELHSGESAACEKGEREIRILNGREGWGKEGSSKMQYGEGERREGIKCVKFGARGSSMAQGFLNKEEN